MKYQLTNSRDGKKRISVKIEARLSLEEIATHVTSLRGTSWQDENYLPIPAKIRADLSSRGKVMAYVQDSVRQDGMELPGYRVGDGDLEQVHAEALRQIEALWAAE